MRRTRAADRARSAPRALAAALLAALALLGGGEAAAQAAGGGAKAGAPPRGGTAASPLTPAPADAAGAAKAEQAKSGAGQARPGTSAPGGVPPEGPLPTAQPGEPLCGWCATTGRTPFDVDKRYAIEQDAGPTWSVQFCSDAIDSPNDGLDWQPCARCKTPSLHELAVKRYDKVAAVLKTWVDGRRKVDRAVGAESPLIHVQTNHFVITWNVPKITTASKQTLRAHEAAHLYAHRMEDLYSKYQAMFGITDVDNLRNLHYIYFFEEPAQAAVAGPLYTALSMGDARTVKRAGGAGNESAIVTWWDRGLFPKDADMYRHQIHNVAHALSAVYYNVQWFPPGVMGLSPPWLSDKYGWMDEGLAHWFEIDFDGKAETYCFREQNTTSRWGGGDWKKNIFKAVAANEVPSFSEVATKPSPGLSALEHQFSWSWCDYLIAKDAAAMGRAMMLCKKKTEMRDILKQCWGLTVLDFEESWKTWVLATYAPAGPGGRK